jgi:glutamate dehydrogenase/leucine dehydrogenase
MNSNLASLIRHFLTAAGGFLVAKGLASADQVAELAGAVVSIAGVGWSVYNNKKAAKTDAPKTE